ncbi:hypothetical protein BJV82DRAFT_623995 [Fennellomyces sp. T-0311]|nr:hypothetical protein BJV82DRAFT_623995 [Fennellomyces sp. T-0311]
MIASLPNNISSTSLSHDYQGWLLISKLRKHLVWRASHNRYFCTLDGQQLRLYNDENDIKPKVILDLVHYNVIATPPSQRGIVFNRTPSQRTFQLVSHESHRPDLVLVAETKEALDNWVEHMTNNNSMNNDILEKWLERFAVNNKSTSSESLPPSPSFSCNSSASSLHKSPLSPLSPVQPNWPPPEKSISTLIQTLIARRKSSPALSTRRRSSISPSSPTAVPVMTLQPIMDESHHH